MVNGKAKVGSSVLVPYGAESSEESDEESKGLAKENGVDMMTSTQSSRPETADEDGEASPHELQESVMLNGANSADSDSRESSLAFDSASCQVQPDLHTENLFNKLNGLPGKVSGREVGLKSHSSLSWISGGMELAARADVPLFRCR